MLDCGDRHRELADGAALDAAVQSNAADAKALFSVRSRGEIRLGFKRTSAGTAVEDFYQSGCLRLRLPRTPAYADPCVVMLNTSGGLADGDRLTQHVAWGEGARASVTGQAAEKVYRALGGGARIETSLKVGPAASAEWLPQETILFDRARLARDMRVTIGPDSTFLGVEAVVFGRAAMDEVTETGALSDRWRIWREGRLIYADALRLEGPIDALMRRAAIGAGARAMAVLIYVSGRAADLLSSVREALAGALGTAAASAWNGMLVVRLLARDGMTLRHDMIRALSALRGGRALPRVWSC